jgi:hypothetical protein
VVQHREADDRGEPAVGKRQLRSVALHDVGAPAELLAQQPNRRLVDLHGGQVGDQRAERPGRGTEAGTDLQHVVTEVDTGERAGHPRGDGAVAQFEQLADTAVVARGHRPGELHQPLP